MSQKLKMPFERQMMLCGYKNKKYAEYWGYPHYGVDISSKQGKAGDNDKIYSSGEGIVLAAGKDSLLGFGAAVLYKNCIGRGGSKRDIVMRYMHMCGIYVRAGDTVSENSVIGREGKEGTGDYHLHLELDTDTREQFAVWTPQVADGRNFWKKGTDTTLNPSLWLWKTDDRDIVEPAYNTEWLNIEDFVIPKADYSENKNSAALKKIATLASEIITLTEDL